VAIGTSAGGNAQGVNAVAIGTLAGSNTQGARSVAIGFDAGLTSQGTSSVAIGTNAGSSNQGVNSIAIGTNAGIIDLAANSVAIGTGAGTANVSDVNSIIINATGAALTSTAAGTLTIAPIRSDAASTPVLVYNAVTKEITYNSSTRNIKKNIIDLTANTAHVYDIRPVEYDAISDNKHFVGLIAEEVYEADPYFAWTQDDNPAGIEWFNILLYTVAELKKMKIKNEELEARLVKLEQKL
jgi:hypothetical protein